MFDFEQENKKQWVKEDEKKEEITLSINTEEMLEWHQRKASPNIRNSP
jgi:hypothetical protein